MKSLREQLQEIFGYIKDNKKSKSSDIAKSREQGSENKLCPYCKQKIDSRDYKRHIKEKHKYTIQSNRISKKVDENSSILACTLNRKQMA